MFTNVLVGLALIHLGGLLSISGLAKCVGHRAFVQTLASHDLLPRGTYAPVAWTVIASELIVGVWLFSGVAFRAAAAFASVVLACFLAYRVALAIFAPEGAECGCHGTQGPHYSRSMPVADALGLVLNLVVALVLAASPLMHRSTLYPPRVSALLAGAAVTFLIALSAVRRQALIRARSTSEIAM
jgi:hypothetical protein